MVKKFLYSFQKIMYFLMAYTSRKSHCSGFPTTWYCTETSDFMILNTSWKHYAGTHIEIATFLIPFPYQEISLGNSHKPTRKSKLSYWSFLRKCNERFTDRFLKRKVIGNQLLFLVWRIYILRPSPCMHKNCAGKLENMANINSNGYIYVVRNT